MFYSMAVNWPKAGEMYLIITPDTKYHPIEAAGPCHPTRTANFLENRIMSSRGFEKLL